MIDTRIVNVNQLQARIGASSGGGATVDAEYVERFNKAVGDPERVKSMWANPATAELLNRALGDKVLRAAIWNDPFFARLFSRVLPNPLLVGRLWETPGVVVEQVGLSLTDVQKNRLLAIPAPVREIIRTIASGG